MLIMGRWEIPVRIVAQGGFATTLEDSIFHCGAANALRHARIAFIKHNLKTKKKKLEKLTSVPFFYSLSNERANIVQNIQCLVFWHGWLCWKMTPNKKKQNECSIIAFSMLYKSGPSDMFSEKREFKHLYFHYFILKTFLMTLMYVKIALWENKIHITGA